MSRGRTRSKYAIKLGFYRTFCLFLTCFFAVVSAGLLPVAALVHNRWTRDSARRRHFEVTRELAMPEKQQLKPVGYLLASKKQPTEIIELEKDVMESTRAKLDLKRVASMFDRDPVKKDSEVHAPSWNVALAAASVTSVSSFFIIHSLALSAVAGAFTFLVATRDPLEEDSAAGAAARVVGRATLKSYEVSQPKVRAIARAAVNGEEEILELQTRVKQLENENAELLLWKQRRIAVDERLPDYSLEELKQRARDARLTVGGTKAQLMMRLVEAEVIKL